MVQTKVYIIILNWNGWQDSIECLESVFRNNYSNYKVIVCDNDSSDGSLQYIKQWAEGNLQTKNSDNEKVYKFTNPPISKPIKYIEYNREQAEGGRFIDSEEPPLILIQTGGNLGFAGGNNVGIRYALVQGDFEYIWLLNNDTVVDSASLVRLVDNDSTNKLKHRKVGIIGSILCYYDNPDMVQGVGGKLNTTFAITKGVGGCILYENINSQRLEIDCAVGASFLVSKQFIEDVGLMDEIYFLYYEEIDWAISAKKAKWEIDYCIDSIVYHKEGSSTGSNSKSTKNKSPITEYYLVRNRLIFIRKHYKNNILTVVLGVIISILNRVRRGKFTSILPIIRGFIEGIRIPV